MARSNAYALLENAAPDDEIAGAISAALDDLRAAIAGYQAETLTIGQLDEAALIRFIDDEVGGFVRLTGGGWLPEHRQEFIDQCCIEFAQIPASLAIPAIRQARRRVFDPKRFVSWVFETVQKDLDRLETEGKMLGELARIAQI